MIDASLRQVLVNRLTGISSKRDFYPRDFLLGRITRNAKQVKSTVLNARDRHRNSELAEPLSWNGVAINLPGNNTSSHRESGNDPAAK
jgi:hypothetical protein